MSHFHVIADDHTGLDITASRQLLATIPGAHLGWATRSQ